MKNWKLLKTIPVFILAFLSILVSIQFGGCGNQSISTIKKYIKQDNFQGAKSELTELLKRDPVNNEALFLMGKTCAQLKEFRCMNENFSRSLEIGDRFSRKIEYIKLDNWAYYFNMAMASYRIHDYDKAITFGEYALAIADTAYAHFYYPDFENVTRMQLVMGESFRELGRIEDANRYYRLCLGNNPDQLLCLNRLADYYYYKTAYDSALIFYQRIGRIRPYDENAAVRAVKCVENIDGVEAAIEMANSKLSSSSRSAILTRYIVNLYLREGNFNGAEFWLENGYVGEKDYDYYFMLGQCKYNLMDFDSAKQLFEKAVGLSPTGKEAWEYLQIIYGNIGDIEKYEYARSRVNSLPGNEDQLKD
ncbi:MAG: tetratricopeptide repeat protein [candidate division Zixibacteria bacterium]|nr:tetratricopeptide repeat protein [candidate division Zixibacteria bacterium]